MLDFKLLERTHKYIHTHTYTNIHTTPSEIHLFKHMDFWNNNLHYGTNYLKKMLIIEYCVIIEIM